MKALEIPDTARLINGT